MSANPDPRALLDALDEAHAKATPGPWGKAWSNHLDDCDVHPVDAALIVAAVNALPALTAAARAALTLADEIDGEAAEAAGRAGLPVEDFVRAWRANAPERIRDTVTAALAGGQP